MTQHGDTGSDELQSAINEVRDELIRFRRQYESDREYLELRD